MITNKLNILKWVLYFTEFIFFVVNFYWLFFIDRDRESYKYITYIIFPILFLIINNLSFYFYKIYSKDQVTYIKSKYFNNYILLILNLSVVIVLISYNIFPEHKVAKLVYATLAGLLFFNNLYVTFSSHINNSIKHINELNKL